MAHWLLRYTLAADYLERRSAYRDAHLRAAWSAARDGALLLGGAVGDPVEEALLLFTDRTVAEMFAATDPYVANGLVLSWSVVPWMTVVGANAAAPVRPEGNPAA